MIAQFWILAFWIPYHRDSLSSSSSCSSCWLQTLHLSIITPCASFNIERRGAKMAYCANYKGHKPFSLLHQRGNHPSSPEVNWTLNANHHDALCWSALSSHHLHRIQPRGSKTLPRRDWGQAAGEDRSLKRETFLRVMLFEPRNWWGWTWLCLLWLVRLNLIQQKLCSFNQILNSICQRNSLLNWILSENN